MSGTDHLAKAKDYIAKGEDFYRRAAEEIVAAKDERPELTWVEIGRQLGRDESWVRKLVAFRKSERATPTPFGGAEENARKDQSATRTVLRDPEKRRQVLASLSHGEIEQVVSEANDVAIERIRAQRDEQSIERKPNAGDLMGGDRFDPSESWADSQIIRINERAQTMRQHVEKWGLVLGSLSEQDAFDYLQAAERDVAEVRVQVQERILDRPRTEARHA